MVVNFIRKHASQRNAVIILAILFIAAGLFVARYPHDRELPDGSVQPGTIPDEIAFYEWAEIAMDGRLTVPISEVAGRYVDTATFYVYNETRPGIQAAAGLIGRDTVQVMVTNNNGNPIHGAIVRLYERTTRESETDRNGMAVFEGVGLGLHRIEVEYWPDGADRPLFTKTTIEVKAIIGQYGINVDVEAEVLDENQMPRARLSVRVTDIFNQTMPDTRIYLDNGPEPIVITDENGEAMIELAIPLGSHIIRAENVVEGVDQPTASVVVEVDGEMRYANRWPPGFSVLLAGLMLIGLEKGVGIILAGIDCTSTYFLSRRFHNWKVAFLATVLVMTSTLGLMMIYSRYMADYASMTFALLGFWLFMEAVEEKVGWIGERRYLYPLLAFLGGLSMATAVTMRYSTIVVCLAPFVYLLARMLKESRAQRLGSRGPQETTPVPDSRNEFGLFAAIGSPHRPRLAGPSPSSSLRKGFGLRGWLPTRQSFVWHLKKAIPLIIGLLVIGAMLASYNSALFGGPFNSGYQMSHDLNQATLENGTINEPSESFFESYFSYDKESLSNLPRLTSILFHGYDHGA